MNWKLAAALLLMTSAAQAQDVAEADGGVPEIVVESVDCAAPWSSAEKEQCPLEWAKAERALLKQLLKNERARRRLLKAQLANAKIHHKIDLESLSSLEALYTPHYDKEKHSLMVFTDHERDAEGVLVGKDPQYCAIAPEIGPGSSAQYQELFAELAASSTLSPQELTAAIQGILAREQSTLGNHVAGLIWIAEISRCYDEISGRTPTPTEAWLTLVSGIIDSLAGLQESERPLGERLEVMYEEATRQPAASDDAHG